ncbi:hypothetical protein SAMN05444320_11711 [Streptoalloteichus hindustanus]|uniref:Uncharacterized protein n=1 Tax=Streptoalloteichus hindustanus TaxID=2017 RepID=A0A1M5NYQ2_STRHI|nr:hypothetical protein SAMN05444320_11711 [Streptoalloteichus hindustanus]
MTTGTAGRRAADSRGADGRIATESTVDTDDEGETR